MRGLGLLLAIVVGPALADGYRMGVLDVEQISAWEYRIVHQFSGLDEAPELRRPASCQQIAPLRRQALPQGARISTIWRCSGDLASVPLELDAAPLAPASYYLNWRAADWQINARALETWPIVATQLRAPAAADAGVDYLQMGVRHILSGWDHLVFIIGLLFLVSAWRRLLWVISAFTLGHSLTLSLSVLGLIALPMAYVELMIALSILLLLAEVLHRARDSMSHRSPALMAALFGLVHGLGFASALRQVGLSGADRAWPLLQFNLGVEIGQLLFVALAYPLLRGCRRIRALPLHDGLIRPLGVCAGYWTVERLFVLAG